MLQPEQKKKKILDILKDIPPEKLDAVIDFAEYLKTRKRLPQKIGKKTGRLSLPTYHLGHIRKGAFERESLYGEYLDRKFD